MNEALWPPPTLQHLLRLTDDCGILQHAKYWSPDYENGYCVDDNSRALIAACRHHRLFGDEEAHELMVRYLAFLIYVQHPDGRIRNFVDYSRGYLEEEGSPDSLGRTLWGLGFLVNADGEHLTVPARDMFRRAREHLRPDAPPHTLAYGILGHCALGENAELRAEARDRVRPLAEALQGYYRETRTDDWEWFLPVLTYDNARLSYALLVAGQLLDDDDMIETGLTSLDFLRRTCFADGHLDLIGCHGWYPRDGERAKFDQQPIDADAMVQACLTAYRITGEGEYFDHAVDALDWFFGKNALEQPLFNEESGGCHDGLEPDGVNCNQGAESTISFLLASLAMYEEAPYLFFPLMVKAERG